MKIILAGPGTGKTTKIKKIINEEYPKANVPLTGAYVDDGTTAKSITTTWGPSHFWSSGVHTIYVHQLRLHSLHYVNSETAVYLNLWQ